MVCRIQTPSEIFYGVNSLQKVGEVAVRLGKAPLIITDEIMNNLGYVKKCQTYLRKKNIKSYVYQGVNSEPTDIYVDEALNVFREKQCDFIISLGGGSCMDAAKAVCVVATNEGYIGEFMGLKRLVDQPPVAHVAIPTTAGTGSEVTDVTVITSTKTHVKMMIKQPAFMPTCAIVDPLLTISTPKSVTAATGIDALSHAIEAFLSKKAHPMTNTFALAAMKLIYSSIKTAYNQGDQVEARDKMALGSMQAGIAFGNSSVALVHGMSRPIGALFQVPHGVSNAMLLPAVLEFSKESCIEELATIGKLINEEESLLLTKDELGQLAVDKIKELSAYLNIPNIKDWGIPKEAFFQALPKMAQDAITSGSPANNPRVPTEAEIISLYEKSYEYNFSKTTLKKLKRCYENGS